MEKAFIQMKKNTVDAKEQLKKSKYVTYINPNGNGKRIMFVGNSITLHGIKEDIGWHNEWGMAASAKEKDYVHRMIDMISEISEDCAFCICQVAVWEQEYKNGTSVYDLFKDARDFQADIIIMRFVENCPARDYDSKVFKKELNSFLNYLSFKSETNIIMSTGFWHHPADETIVEYANERNLPLVELGDLGERDEMKAVGCFEHVGVANHPGDLGMKEIAERLFNKIVKVL